MTQQTAVKVERITITRGEGPSIECRIPHHASSWSEANEILKRMAITAPESGSDKTDFHIQFSNAEEYKGCYELKRKDTTEADLFLHCKLEVEFYAGKYRPAHWKSESEYELYILDSKAESLAYLENTLYPSAEHVTNQGGI
jgi:hypothetical protein